MLVTLLSPAESASWDWLPIGQYQLHSQEFRSVSLLSRHLTQASLLPFPSAIKACILPGLLYRELNLLPICFEGPQRPEFFPECSCRPALPFLPGLLRVTGQVLSRKLLLITPGLACTGVHALLQHRGGRVRPLCLDPGPCTLPPSHTQSPTPATVCCRRSNPLELS